MLSRFKAGGSIDVIESGRQITHSQPQRATLSIPKANRASEIRHAWEKNRRSIPRTGIVFPDGSVMTILFEWQKPPIPRALQPVASHISYFDSHGELSAFVNRYSYCFFPNSESAEAIGYFRYDFHSDAMGEGDLGEHAYFHLHHRKVERGFRLATGPVTDFDKVVSGIEGHLAPIQRRNRLRKSFEQGKFNELLFDLTVDGIKRLHGEILPRKADVSNFKHKEKYEEFLKTYE